MMRHAAPLALLKSGSLGAFGLVVAALGLAGLAPHMAAAAADCRSYAAPGVDWSNCSKRMLIIQESSLDNANLKAADFSSTDLRKSSLNGVNFEKAKLVRTFLEGSQLKGANFNKVEAYRSDFSGVVAPGATFVNAEVQRASFKGANLQGVDFTKAELGRADFDDANLIGTTFTMANLSRARLNGAKFAGPVDFRDSFLLLTRIEGVDLAAATGLKQHQINLACGDEDTRLPQGLSRPESWPCPNDSDAE
jgi:uncharacterized protein YjbI with pentapeptide repeats